MFQQTIQDVLALAEAGAGADAILECVRERMSAFERFEGAELLARTEAGLHRFAVAPGLGNIGPAALEALGPEPMLRVDTAEDMTRLGLSDARGLPSLLVLSLPTPGVRASAIVLGHSRPWSFAGTPLSRVRTIGQVALRLLLSGAGDGETSAEVARLQAEVNRLRTQVATLKSEIASLRSELGG